MKIKHREAGIEYTITGYDWRINYLNSEKHKQFEIISYDGLVEVHSINEVTGESNFSHVSDIKDAQTNTRNHPKKIYMRPLEFKHYNKQLLLYSKKPTNQNLFLRIWNSLPSIKKTLESIINSTISKEIWLIIRGVVILIVAYVLWEVFKESILSVL